MTDKYDDGPKIPEDAHDSIAQAERHIADVRDYVSDRLAFLAMAGANEEDRQELQHISSMLKTLGESAMTGAAQVDEADIQVSQPQAEQLGLDEDLAYSLFEEFVDSRRDTAFTTAELKMYLADNGVHASGRDFAKLFPNWRKEILAERRELGHKVDFEKLEKGTYAFVVLRGPEPKRAPSQQNIHKSPEVALMATDIATRVTLEVISANPTQTASKHVHEIAHLTGMVVKDVRLICDTLVGSGMLHKRRSQGSLYFTAAAPEAAPTVPKPPVSEKTETTEVLSTEHEQIARKILEALGTLGRYYGQGMLTDQLERYLVSTGIPMQVVDDKVVKRIARQLSKAGVVEAGQSKHRSGGSKFRVRAVSPAMNKAIHDANNVDAIIEAIRSQRTFTVESK